MLPHVQPSDNANHCEEGHDEGPEHLNKNPSPSRDFQVMTGNLEYNFTLQKHLTIVQYGGQNHHKPVKRVMNEHVYKPT